jgi:hypothetical protein
MAQANPSLPPKPNRFACAVLARQAALKAVKHNLAAQGVRVAYMPHRELVAAAEVYLRDHPELFAEAGETVWTSPELRTLAERAERRLRGNRRLAKPHQPPQTEHSPCGGYPMRVIGLAST